MILSKLAFVIAVKNGAKTIAACLDSLAPALAEGAQLYVYDSLSTDDTQSIVASRFPKARYTCKKDGGLYYAWNLAIVEVAEPYLFFINCDDTLHSTSNLCSILGDLKDNSEAVASSGQTIMTRIDGATRYAGARLTQDWFVGDMPIVTPATIFTVRALRELDGFDTRYRISADYDLALRMLARYGHRAILFRPLHILRFSLGGMSNIYRKQAFMEIRHIVSRNLGRTKLAWHLLSHAKIELKRTLLNLYFMVRPKT
jgi:glycosyltransferase involved in cell wall biosynthesis